MAGKKVKPCHAFLRGSCTFGARCKFSHAHLDKQAVNKQPKRPPKSIALDGGSDQAFRQWRYMVPMSNSMPHPLRERLGEFFQQALELVRQDPGIMQEVVTLLATEGGLQRINELAQQNLDGLSKLRKADVFSSQILPLYKLIAHPNVLMSAILEQSIGTLYNYLYGLNGQRAIKLFWFSTQILETDEFPIDSLEACVVVFSRMIDINVTATVNDQLHGPAKALAKLVESRNSDGGQALLNHVERINRRLDLGLQMQTKSSSESTKTNTGKAEFKLEQPPPGGRHDNDSADIGSIRILPTFNEIQSSHTEYLPVNDPERLHLPGLQGLLDRQFRLLREDNVGPLRDAIRAELRVLHNTDSNHAAARPRKLQQRIHSYQNVTLESPSFERRLGFRFTARFDKPAHLRGKSATQQGDWWEQSRRLQLDSLVCLLGSKGSVIFCCVVEPADAPSHTKSGSLRNGHKKNGHPARTVCEMPEKSNRAYVTLTPALIDNMNIQQLMENFIACQRAGRVSLALAEFPGVLLPSFQPTLLALQQMQQTADLPFANFLAPPNVQAGTTVDVPPPAYSVEPGFRFKLDCLMDNGQELLLNTREPFDLEKLQDGSSLDDAQAAALVDSLSRCLALIQGPPGTGKSYTGVALIKVLLANKWRPPKDRAARPRAIRGQDVNMGADIGPILCVCYTNHALDQLLEHLVKGGVDQVIRIGSRSKSELLSDCTLRKVAEKMQKTKAEGSRMFELIKELENSEEELYKLLNQLAHADSQKTLRSYLQSRYPKHDEQLFGLEDDEGFTEVRHNKKSALDDWLRRGNRDPEGTVIRPRHPRVLTRVPLKAMSHSERQVLHEFWLSEITRTLFEKVKRSLLDSQLAKKQLDRVRREVDLRCLNQANIIGATTTGLARNIDLLRRVTAKVMLCEEAGEVLESHTITAFLPSVQHVILIGDHLQLRPQIQNYNLQHDSPNGKQYSLDISLFERLVRPPGPAFSQLPFTTLETQRRMHPSISRLIRDTLYPRLQDSTNVSDYPKVSGLRKRLFWFDHEMPENGESEAVVTSRTNDFEVEMTAAMVTHLVRQGVYSSEDIAVLTPYLGQLQKLKRRFASSFEIVLNDRDEHDLQNAGLEDAENGAAPAAPPIPVAKTSLGNALRVATVDNFQGEEAAVVVVSLVRCNAKNNCGFLKTFNRINVLLSRAKHGMYIIGNARTSSHVEMWNNVISILKESDNFGTSLELMCSRHPKTPIAVSKPDDFSYFSPEGGCSLKCDKRLQCGHACLSKCHSDVLHSAIKCLEPCPRSLKGCNHACPRACGDHCVPKCPKPVHDPDRVLPCGHKEPTLPCWQSQDLTKVDCKREVVKTITTCGHEVRVPCHCDVNAETYECTAPCGALLPCAHACRTECKDCRTHGDHGECSQPCGRNFTTCQHVCTAKCHREAPCPPCDKPCEVACSHSRCSKKCNEPCVPCAEERCASSCPHSQCTVPCAVPCNHLPCSRRCQDILACGHQCPSVCGEACPSAEFCQICANDEIRDMSVDFLEGLTYKEIDLDEDPCIFPNCGHAITMTNLDGHMSLADHYEFSPDGSITNVKSSDEPFSSKEIKICPNCRGSLRNIARYGRIVRRALLDEATKKFIVWSNTKYVALAGRLCDEQKELENSVHDLGGFVLPKNVSIEGERRKQLASLFKFPGSKRYSTIKSIGDDIAHYTRQVRKEEQPFQRVADLVRDARRRRGCEESLLPVSDVLQTRGIILASSLSLQCDLTIMSDFISLRLKAPRSASTASELHVDFSRSRDVCLSLVSSARSSNYPVTQIEGHIYFAKYAALERPFLDPDRATVLHEQAIAQLATARDICEEYPSAAHKLKEIDVAEQALRGSTFYSVVSNQEMQAAVAAMRSELRGTGHWYYCENNHPFTIGECGMAMEEAVCPQCGARIGGRNHRTAEGVRAATDLETGMGNLAL